MKNILFLFVMLVTTVSFANDPPSYDVGTDDQVTVTIDQNVDVYVATINLQTMEVVQSEDSFAKTSATKIVQPDGNFFVAIKTETQECAFVYCTNTVKKIDPGWQLTNGKDKATKTSLSLNVMCASSGGLPYNC